MPRPIEDVILEEASKRKRLVLFVDQIDALSLSLSANRTPLRSLLSLIKRLANIPRVRVVISCRPYDLEYDPELQNLKIKNQWELKELSEEQVLQTLRSNGHNESMDDRFSFLNNCTRFIYTDERLLLRYRRVQCRNPLIAETCSVRYVTASDNFSNGISLSMFANTFVLVILRILIFFD